MKRLLAVALLASSPALAADVPLVTEVLILNSAGTVIPRSGGRRALEIQNLGPNPIYCAFSAAANAVLTKSRKIDTGQSWSLNFGSENPSIHIYCRAATADQVTGAATIVTEI